VSGKPRFVAIIGTTAAGKTDLSLALAEHMPVEIISMDSRQVYIGMDIGTDKVSAADRACVPHHGLDMVPANERYSAGQFARDARRWIDEIEGRGCLPLLVGGTGFFLKAVMDPIFAEPPLDTERLERLRAWLSDQPRELLEGFVTVLDPERAPVAIAGGPQRMSRTIEVALLTGRALSEWHRTAPTDGAGVSGVVLLLDLPVEATDRSIDGRVQGMVDRGLVQEVQSFLDEGYGDSDPGMTGTGYREISAYLRDETTLEEAMDDIRKSTRRYSRRQRTWYRNQLPDPAVRIDATRPLDEQVAAALSAMNDAGMDVRSRPAQPVAEGPLAGA